MISWLRFREKIEKLLKNRYEKKKKSAELDEDFRKRMKDAYEAGLQQSANIGKVM